MDDSDYDDYHSHYNSHDDEDDAAHGSEDDTDDSYDEVVEEEVTEDDEEDPEEEMMGDADEQEEDIMEDLEEEEPEEYDEEEEDVLAEYFNLEDGEDVMVETDYEAEGELVEDEEEEEEPEEEQGVAPDFDEEDGTDDEDETDLPSTRWPFRPRVPSPFLRFLHNESGLSDTGGALVHGGDRGGTGSGAETSPSRTTGSNVDRSRGCDSQGNESNWSGFEGPICPICFERWAGEGEHSVCCLPCGHLYGLSCIVTWLHQPNSQKCPQCNEECETSDIRRHYGVHIAATSDEELKQKVKSLEAKCAALELKDAIWLRKEAEWQKREADLEQQLNQHKTAGLMTDTSKQGDPGDGGEQVDDPEGPEPTNAHKDSRDGTLL